MEMQKSLFEQEEVDILFVYRSKGGEEIHKEGVTPNADKRV